MDLLVLHVNGFDGHVDVLLVHMVLLVGEVLERFIESVLDLHVDSLLVLHEVGLLLAVDLLAVLVVGDHGLGDTVLDLEVVDLLVNDINAGDQIVLLGVVDGVVDSVLVQVQIVMVDLVTVLHDQILVVVEHVAVVSLGGNHVGKFDSVVGDTGVGLVDLVADSPVFHGVLNVLVHDVALSVLHVVEHVVVVTDLVLQDLVLGSGLSMVG